MSSSRRTWRSVLVENGVGLDDVWLRYFEFGGSLGIEAIASFVDGDDSSLGDGDRAMVRQAVIEILDERGIVIPPDEQ